MRLADQIIAARGGFQDQLYRGAVSSFAQAVADAERFELDDQTEEAIRHVARSRPSSILSALPFARLPYPKVWVERCDDPLAPDADPECPYRLGFLMEAYDDDLSRCSITWAWTHSKDGPEKINICALAVACDWSADAKQRFGAIEAAITKIMEGEHGTKIADHFGSSVAEILCRQQRVQFSPGKALEMLRKLPNARWRNISNDQREIEAMLTICEGQRLLPSTHFLHFFCDVYPTLSLETKRQLEMQWHHDLEGEYCLAEAFVCMINAKNAVTIEREDLSRLNRARAKRSKSPLLEYNVTRLALRPRDHAPGVGKPHGSPRRHLVRGHFKVRRGGIFWWSPFVRGGGEKTLVRKRYDVVA